MSFNEAVRSGLKQYAGFTGRARRTEFWFFALFYIMAVIAGAVIDGALGFTGGGLLTAVALFGLLLPSLAVTVRRLHDTGRSGWWYLISFVPLGGLVIFVFMLLDSQPTANRWGPSPKASAVAYGVA